MMPASHIGKENYQTLGNQRVGETHASRMRRVNSLQPIQTQLAPLNRPMGTVKTVAASVPDAISYGLIGGLIGGLVSLKSNDRTSRAVSTGLGVFLGSVMSLRASKNTNSGEPWVDSKSLQILVGGGILILGGLGSGITGLDWKAMKGQSFNKNALSIMIPAGMVGIPMMAGASSEQVVSLGLGSTAAVAGVAITHRLLGAISN
jgi:hypothetical protein